MRRDDAGGANSMQAAQTKDLDEEIVKKARLAGPDRLPTSARLRFRASPTLSASVNVSARVNMMNVVNVVNVDEHVEKCDVHYLSL